MVRCRCRSPFVLALLLALPAGARALPPVAKCGPSPLVYVRLIGPPGSRATFFQGTPTGYAYDLPVAAGLRPGYYYRLMLTGLGEDRRAALYPTLHVIGTLQLSPKLSASDFPVPLVFYPEDVERALAGSLVTRVVYLEDPDRAFAEATEPNRPIEFDVGPQGDPLAEARERGRPMVVVRFGGREVSPDELAHQSVPGTILLPGAKALAPAAVPPPIPWACVPIYDPFLGPKPPTEECLHDGGDVGLRAGIGPDGKLGGLDPTDAVAEYSDSSGNRRVVCSNRVCVCVPRYVIARNEIVPSNYEAVLTPVRAEQVRGQTDVATFLPPYEKRLNEQAEVARGRLKASATFVSQNLVPLINVTVLNAEIIEIGPAVLLGTEQLRLLRGEQYTKLVQQMKLAQELSVRTGLQEVEQAETTQVVGRVLGLDVIKTVLETRDYTCVCCECPRPPDKPLALCKWAGAQKAQVGDVVTFYLKYGNHGGQPITDIAVSDSLGGRLEYVPGSAKSDHNAVLTVQDNEAGSVILRWEVAGKLLPGENGVVSFQARVR